MRLILTNSEARKLLSDASLIGRDLFARGASKAAESARPAPEQLARVDDAAPSDEFIGPNGTTHGPNDPAPDVMTDEQADRARGALDTAKQARDLRNDVTQQGRELATDAYKTDGGLNEKLETAQRGATDRAADKSNEIPQEHRERANDVATGIQGDGQQLRSEVEEAPEGEKGQVAKQGLKDRLFGVKEKIPQEHRDRANHQFEKGKSFLQDEFPEERRDQVRSFHASVASFSSCSPIFLQYIYRLKKVLVECQKHQDYQEALTWFLSALETYFSHGRTLANHHANKAGDVVEDPSLQRATSELRTLLERFANGKSVDGIIDAANALNQDAQNDEDLRAWFNDMDSYVRRVGLYDFFADIVRILMLFRLPSIGTS